MKQIAALLVFLLLPALAQPAQKATYSVAHTKYRDVNMVFIVTNGNFFQQTDATQEKWYTAAQACARGVKLGGEVVLVADYNGRFHYYGPKKWREFLSTLDMAWVKARLNKKLTCNY